MLKPEEALIAKERASGTSFRKIGEMVGKSGVSVYNTCQKEEVKKLIEEEQSRLVELLPTAVSNYKKWIELGQISNDKDAREIAFKASTKILESTGLINGTPSTLVQVMYNDNKTVISPVISKLLETFVGQFKEEVIDVDPEGEMA